MITDCISRPYLHKLSFLQPFLFDILFLPIIVAAVRRFGDSIAKWLYLSEYQNCLMSIQHREYRKESNTSARFSRRGSVGMEEDDTLRTHF